MKNHQKALVFTPELGARLRQLRKDAGLNQDELAQRMGRKGKGSRSMICRLELGYYLHPTIGLIADYLKACKAGFADIADLLGMEPAHEQEKPPKRKQKHETYEEKLAAVRHKAQRLYIQGLVEEMLYKVLTDEDLPQGFEEEKKLATYGRKVFAGLERHHRSRQRLRKELFKDKRIRPEHADLIERVIEGVFLQMVKAGDFERKPDVDATAVVAAKAHLAKVKKAEDRILKKEEQKFVAWGRKRARVIDQIRLESMARLQNQGMTENQAAKYANLVSELCGIASESGPSSKERERKSQEVIGRAKDKTGVKRLIEYVYQRWDELEPTIPNQPKGLSRRSRPE